ncbi:MAG: hypothetical protein ABI972_29650, partial [Acidobacteriota bacterium]
LIERLGRLRPGVYKPGIVVLRPFLERLVVIPAAPFPIQYDTKTEIAGSPLSLTFHAHCWIQDPVKFQQNVPLVRYANSNARAEKFIGGLLDSEGRALLRELSAHEGLANPYDFCRRLEGRLEWHTRSVGMKLSEMKISGLGLPPEPA